MNRSSHISNNVLHWAWIRPGVVSAVQCFGKRDRDKSPKNKTALPQNQKSHTPNLLIDAGGCIGIDICHTSNEILRVSWVNESISQSANQPNRDPVLQSQKVLWRCSEGALWDVVICRRLGDFLFCGTVVFGNTEQPRHWITETTPGRIQAQWRTLLEMCELLFMTFYLPRKWRSLRKCL